MLLPERHPVRDFFVLDVHDVDPRSDIASMEHPIFSLSTKPDGRTLKYQHGDVGVEIIPSSVGLPTVFDKDILIYCISKLVAMRDAGEPIGRTVRLTTHDLLVNTNRPTNDLGYQRLAPALDGGKRLRRQSFVDILLERKRREQVLEHDQVLELGGFPERVDQRLAVLEPSTLAATRAPADGEDTGQRSVRARRDVLDHAVRFSRR